MPIYFDAFTRFGPKPRQHAAQRWTLDHLVEEMRHCSISGALVTHNAQLLYDPMMENLRLLDRIKDHDFLFPIWNVMPHQSGAFPEPSDLLQQMSDRNVRAVVLHPRTQAWNLTSRSSRPLLDALEKHRIFTILDAAGEVDFEKLEQILVEHPALPVFIRGMYWSVGNQVIPLIRAFPNLHLGFDTFQINYGIEELARMGHEDQLVFCSNAADMSMGAHRTYIDYADVPEPVKAKIAGGNLSRLLRGLAPPREMLNADEDLVMGEARRGKPLSPLVLDIHAHILDEGLHGAGGSYIMWNGGPTPTRRLAERMGVKGIGLMSWNGPVGCQAEEGNQCVRAALDAHPDFFWGLGTFDVMHLTPAQMRAQMEALYADKRFLGLKPYPTYGIPYDDKRYECWWEFGNERRLYCGLHPVNWWKSGEFENICPKYPEMTIVGYHCAGAWEIADASIGLAKKYPNFHAEITLTPVWGGIIDYMAEHAGADRILYGSDLPMRDPRQQLGWVIYSRLKIEDKLRILGGNTQRILNRVRSFQK